MTSPRVVSLSAGPGALSAALPCGAGLRAGISLAAAGDMALSRRDLLPYRARFAASLGVSAERVYGLRQVHSRRVVVVDAQGPSALADREADGMVTHGTDVLLTVTVADCLPIILHDRATGAFGLVHSGWKGTGIVVDALRMMAASYGTRALDVLVTIGPGIGACCYGVPEERARGFAADFGPAAVTRPESGADPRPRLDLRAANVALLHGAGVQDITVVSDCTSCTLTLGSFRRQGPQGCTLMLAYAGAVPVRDR